MASQPKMLSMPSMPKHRTCGVAMAPDKRAAARPWVPGLVPACSPGQGTPCPWLAELPALATSTAPLGAT
ncbi:hypothetical protein HaLaN_28315 [Haematococcus lacustris]|uniref:Uncharacterized protein n=1 Tax=Haematococcus lacustris TaxID=44745 RepID=A0A6A0AAD7_HAELA|nr:hypothetical protein HaLaN_28315 [Haematococcus lacustris]